MSGSKARHSTLKAYATWRLDVAKNGETARKNACATSCSEGRASKSACATFGVGDMLHPYVHPVRRNGTCRHEWRHGTQKCVRHAQG